MDNIRFSVDGKNVEVSNYRELMLASTYAAVVKNLKIKTPIKEVLEKINSVFDIDFTFRELLEFLDKNNFHEDLEHEDRRHQLFLAYGKHF